MSQEQSSTKKVRVHKGLHITVPMYHAGIVMVYACTGIFEPGETKGFVGYIKKMMSEQISNNFGFIYPEEIIDPTKNHRLIFVRIQRL